MNKRPSPHRGSANDPDSADDFSSPDALLRQRHLRFGWWTLLLFLSLGIGLEMLHAFKIGWYLDALADSQTRREHWNLAHAHGTMLALVNLAFAFSVAHFNPTDNRCRQIASPSLMAASLLMPAGFFLGGWFPYSGDPGLGILLVPVGGFLLLLGVLLAALGLRR
jgi:hypothetical protein